MSNKIANSIETQAKQTEIQLAQAGAQTQPNELQTERAEAAPLNQTFNVTNTYKHAVSSHKKNQHHFFEVDGSKHDDLKNKFKRLKGDYLKTRILEDFKRQIENTSKPEELNKLKVKIINSAEYKVLKTGQGLVTRIFQKLGISSKKTSSIEALESMFAQQEQNLSETTPPKLDH